MNIYQRINEVMKVVKYVQKDATVQNYKAVSHDQVIAACRPEFVKQGIVIYPEQMDLGSIFRPEGSKMHLYNAFYRINFVNMDEPTDRIQVPIEAHAQDNGDKAPGKAVTYATKAAILKVLGLETGENDEGRVPTADVDDEIAAIEGCETIESLQKIFASAWVTNQSKAARDELTRAKDAAKARLMEKKNAGE